MTNTAERAAKPEGTGYRFLKLRMQGTKKDLKWFRRVLERSKKVKLLDISEPFANKGTNKYYRVYAEVERKEADDNE